MRTLSAGQAEAGRDLVPVHVQPLGGHEQVDAAVLGRYGQARLGAEEGLVLHADLVFAADHHVGGVSGWPLRIRDVPDQVSALVQGRGVRVQGRARVGHRRQHLVGGVDPGRRPAGRLRMVGRDQCHRLALVPDLRPQASTGWSLCSSP